MFIILLLLSLIRALQSAPTPTVDIPESSQLYAQSYLCNRSSNSPGERGVRDIVLSCLATVFACTWTAIHPNIPSPTDSGWVNLKRRVITTVYALLAPEVVVYWAMKQRIMAARIASNFNEEFVEEDADDDGNLSFVGRISASIHEWFVGSPPLSPLEDGEARKWTITHGFFVQMGGFMLSERGCPVQTLPYSNDFNGGKDEGIDGIEELIKNGTIEPPMVTEADIKDRSKGDTISKAVVLLQTSWFITQCIARWSQHLGVTELEVVTLGFALLNGFTYALWWNKPQGVGVPVYIEKKKASKEKASKEEASKEKAIDRPLQEAQSELPEQDEIELVEMTNKSALAMTSDTADIPTTETLDSFSTQDKDNDSEREDNAQLNILDQEEVRNVDINITSPPDVSDENIRPGGTPDPSIQDEDEDYAAEHESHEVNDMAPLNRRYRRTPAPKRSFLSRKIGEDYDNDPFWKFWAVAIPFRLFQALLRPLYKMLNDLSIDKGDLRVPMFYAALTTDVDDGIIIISSSAIAMFFGSVHLIPSWYLHFPSEAAKWLWIVSSIVITAEPLLMVMAYLLDLFEDLFSEDVLNWLGQILGLFLLLGSLFYIFARLGLIVFAFMALRFITLEDLSAIDWVSAIPHF